MKGRMMMAIVALGATIGCGSGQSDAERAAEQIREGAEQVQRSAEQMAGDGAQDLARGLEQMAQGFQQMAQQSDVEVVDFEALKAALPQVDGWTQGNARGEQMSMPIRHSRAEAQYTRENGSVELEITDSAMNQLLLAPMSMFLSAGYSERSDEGFKRSAKIGGHPAMEEWNSSSKRGEVIVVVDNRFIVQATGHDVDDLDTVRQFIDAIDLSKLAGLN